MGLTEPKRDRAGQSGDRTFCPQEELSNGELRRGTEVLVQGGQGLDVKKNQICSRLEEKNQEKTF